MKVVELIPLHEARFLFPDIPSLATLYRWTSKGKWGVVLRRYVGGKGFCTTQEAISQFCGQLSQIADQRRSAKP